MDDEMSASLLEVVESTILEADQITDRTARIHAALLEESEFIDRPNFIKIHPSDLQRLFDLYDDEFFGGQIRQRLAATPLKFSLSRRMTSSGGATTCYFDRSENRRWLEISVSTAILFGSFDGNDHRPIKNSGILCRNRLEALQRIMEHELVHLVEMLLWDKSSCAHSRFHSISRRFFGHTENKHQLITPQEKAIVQFGIRPGMLVRFRCDGVEHQGVVNRIRKRATVLVENQKGEPYSDGKRYAKFYVPIHLLSAVE